MLGFSSHGVSLCPVEVSLSPFFSGGEKNDEKSRRKEGVEDGREFFLETQSQKRNRNERRHCLSSPLLSSLSSPRMIIYPAPPLYYLSHSMWRRNT
jgi:hypothetical protein